MRLVQPYNTSFSHTKQATSSLPPAATLRLSHITVPPCCSSLHSPTPTDPVHPHRPPEPNPSFGQRANHRLDDTFYCRHWARVAPSNPSPHATATTCTLLSIDSTAYIHLVLLPNQPLALTRSTSRALYTPRAHHLSRSNLQTFLPFRPLPTRPRRRNVRCACSLPLPPTRRGAAIGIVELIAPRTLVL